MAVSLSLQVLTVMALIAYFKLKMALIFALILTLSVLNIYGIYRVSFPESRVFVVGLDTGWNLFYLAVRETQRPPFRGHSQITAR